MVFVAPDGDLNSISFAGLLDENGRYLVDRFAFHYLSAGRDLARLAKQGESGQGLLALGDPDYDAVGSSAGAPPVAVGAALAQIGYYHTRNVRSGCERLKGVSVPALPGTRREVELVASKWNRASKEPASVYFGSDASEERLKAESSGKRVIHLATHGYFLGDVCQPDVPGSAFDGSGIGGVWEFVGENPLLLSGLFLAGCNLRGACADSMGIEDGILTAYEVSAMNLEGTDLVVLSACETGLGDVKQGEGVYGLRRAFQMAGARTVVSSLWAVPDEATADMMSGLYERRAASIPDTMRRMQLQKIRDLRRHRKADHPYTWAGFIATGDWR
jgi:CHAT domain-containing protein